MVNGKTRPFVLLGSPVEHSLSPAMYTAVFRALGINAGYLPLRCTAEDIPHLIRILARSGGGGNVTIPHKSVAAPAVSHPSALVRSTGACNTFWGSKGNEAAHGENTDVAGVLAALDRLEAPASNWLILGTGGSAHAVGAAAADRGAAIAVQSRSADRQRSFEAWASDLGIRLATPGDCEVVINATPLGLDSRDPLPIRPDQVGRAVVALDLVYGSEGTRWSQAMASRGLRASDGREALVGQGAAALRCWFPEYDPPVEVMRAVVNARLR
jgi:shikimate dehydrogenase